MPSAPTHTLTPESLVFLEAIMLKANDLLQRSGSYLLPHPTKPNTFVVGELNKDARHTFTVDHYEAKTSLFTAAETTTGDVFWFSTTDEVLQTLPLL